jgi:hypothetical protein
MITATVKECTVTIHNVMGVDKTYSDQDFAFGPYRDIPINGNAEWYIIKPQLSPTEQMAFRSPFSNAVDIYCVLSYSAEPYIESTKAPPADCGLGCKGLYQGIRKAFPNN